MGVNLVHANMNSNWVKFLDRLGVNEARFVFVTASSDLRHFIGTTQWSNDLNGNKVINQDGYLLAITLLHLMDIIKLIYGKIH
jgi:hypothetical protein